MDDGEVAALGVTADDVVPVAAAVDVDVCADVPVPDGVEVAAGETVRVGV